MTSHRFSTKYTQEQNKMLFDRLAHYHQVLYEAANDMELEVRECEPSHSVQQHYIANKDQYDVEMFDNDLTEEEQEFFRNELTQRVRRVTVGMYIWKKSVNYEMIKETVSNVKVTVATIAVGIRGSQQDENQPSTT